MVIQRYDQLNVTEQCKCLFPCTSINYRAYTKRFRTYSEAEGHASSCNETRPLTIEINFKREFSLPLERVEVFGFPEFVSYCGGFLSLFMGFSVLVIVELINFVCIRPLSDFLLRKRLPKIVGI